ncbi:MAG: glycosyltransferase [Chitinophagaceae bacterium]|nr:glycosyltransferase [Rubrivivax sp.]
MNDVDIVIPSAGRQPDVQRLLRSLRRCCGASMPGVVASITVSDDRFTAAEAEQLAAEFPGVRYIAGPARGPAANRNHGAARGHATWVLFLDDDCYLEVDLLQAYLAQARETPDCDVLEGAIHPVGPRPNGNHHAPLNLSGGCLWSCNLMVRRAVFERVGGFDEQFPFACMEDVDLRERLRAAAARTCFVRNAVVLHPWRSISERELTRQIISHAIYAAKHPEFVRSWTPLHALRMAKGRLWLYAAGGFGTIPRSKYRTVAYDLMAPFALLAVTRVAPLRSRVDQRYRNGPRPAVRA